MSGPRYNKDTGRWELPARRTDRDDDRTGSQALPPSVATIEPERAPQGRLWGIVTVALALVAGIGVGVFVDQWDLSAILDSLAWWEG